MMIARDPRLAAHRGSTRGAAAAGSVAVVAVGLRTPIILVIAGVLLWLVGLTHGLAVRPCDHAPRAGGDRRSGSTPRRNRTGRAPLVVGIGSTPAARRCPGSREAVSTNWWVGAAGEGAVLTIALKAARFLDAGVLAAVAAGRRRHYY